MFGEDEKMKEYLPPNKTSNCNCLKNEFNPFFCMTGHLTECHYPLSCEQADCSHIPQYYEPKEYEEYREIKDYIYSMEKLIQPEDYKKLLTFPIEKQKMFMEYYQTKLNEMKGN